MNLEMLINITQESTVIELVDVETRGTFYCGYVQDVFSGADKKYWRHYPVRFLRPVDDYLYVEVDRDI